MSTRSPYSGASRKLVLALDVGTTFSGISYCILEPGHVPQIKGVTRFPAQERVGGDSKIPSIVYYNKQGEVAAIGAEAVKDGIEGVADEEGWSKAEWFKLHLRPAHMANEGKDHVPVLPKRKSTIDVFADFLRYLYECALAYIRDSHCNGAQLLASVEQNIEFVLTHPNGWEGAQQAQMRKALVCGRLIPDTGPGHARVHFVTEGEAGLHFCVENGLTTEALKNGEGIMIVDAGGGTVDISAYGQMPNSEWMTFQEIAPSQCIFEGSVFVTRNARTFLQDRLRDSIFCEEVDHIATCFDKTTKLTFRNTHEPQFIKFGLSRDKDHSLNIRSGQLKLTGNNVASFFEPCLASITQAIISQTKDATRKITSVFLIGGFGSNDWLFSQLKSCLKQREIDLCRPDSYLNKAVADGAISFYLDRFVKARVARYTFGVKSYTTYDRNNAEHRHRVDSVFTDSDGVQCVQHVFSPILKKNTEVMETMEFREKFFRQADSPLAFQNPMLDEIICYRGPDENPCWVDVDREMYSTLCTVVSDISSIRDHLRRQRGNDELTAQISWKDHGRERRGPAKVIYLDQ
ncbi:Heat shock protein 12A [Hypsizygus marmoreus]|uniref:Heat shock protein 12A n=1 Tax=Hypsizygus marmoreus TaxID=39966 RepID=A0A369JEH2_HYPMA|nr:Heat shock protein 12A [Hypsizygus marmoreus]